MESKSTRILIIEDQEDHIDLIRKAFKSPDNTYLIDAASNLKEAKNHISNNKYNIIITDVVLPDGDGMEIFQHQEYKDLFPVIVMTSHGDESKAVKAIKAGALDYIIKTSDSIISLPKIVERTLREWDHTNELKKAEKKIREGEKYYREFIDNSLTGIVIVDIYGNILKVNSKILEILGSPSGKETKAINMFSFEPLVKAGISGALKECIRDDKSLLFDQYYTSKWGKTSYLTYNFTPLHNESGEITSVLINIIDISARKQAEDALRESEERMKSAFIYATIGMAFVALDGRWLKVNPPVCKMLGYTEAELMSKTFQDVTHPNDLDADLEYVRKMLSGEIQTYHMEKRYFHKDGHIVWVMLSVSLVRDNQGNPVHFISQIQDITARKNAENALRESEERYRIAIESANDGIVIVQNDIHIYANKEFLNIFGYSSLDEIIGTKRRLIVHPDDYERVESYAQAREKGKDALSRYEFKGIRKDGTKLDIEVSVNTILYREEKAILAYMRDITERKLTEKAIRESEDRYRKLVESQLEAVCRWLPDTTLTFVNESYCRLFGKTKDELIGNKWIMLIPDKEREAVQNNYIKVASMKQVYSYEHEVNSANGIKWYSWTDVPLFDNKGNLFEFQSVGRDITDRKQVEEKLFSSSVYTRNLIETSLDPLVTISAEGKITDVNTATEKITGKDRHSLIGSDFSDNFTDPEMARAGYRKAFEQGEIIDYPLSVRHTSGEISDVLYNASVYRNNQGEVQGVFAAARNVTERMRIEKALLKSEEKYRTLQENLPIGLVRTTLEGKVLYGNPALAKIFGYDSLEEFLKINVADLYFSREDRKLLLHKLETEGSVINFEAQMKRKDGTVIWASTSINAVFNDEGKFIFLDGFCKDITERKKTELALKRNEELYSALFQNIPVQTVVVDKQGKVIAFNKAKESSGDRLPEIGVIMYKDYASKHNIDMHKELLECINTGKMREFPELPYNDKILTIKFSPFKEGAIIISRDITDQKKAEEKLRESEERYRLIADNMLDLIALYDADGKGTFISPSSKQVLGYSPEENLGKPVYNLIHPDDRERIINSYEQLKTSKNQMSVVFRSHHKEGYYIWLETNAHSIFNSNGEYIGAVMTSRDVTARKLAEEKIEHLNELLLAIRNVDQLIAKEKNTEKLIEGICDCLIQSRGHKNIWIVLTDNSNNITAAADSGFGNKFLNSIKNQKNLSSINCFNYFENNTGIIILYDKTSCGSCEFAYEDKNISRVIIQLKHNNKVYGLMNVGVLKEFINEDEEKSLLEELAEDIAFGLYNIELEKERKELQKQLYRSARLSAVGQLAAGIAHEFNNLLSIILGHTQLSLEEDSIDEIKKSLKEIEKTTKRGGGIVIKLAAFAKPKEPDFRPQEISKIIEDVIKLQDRQLHLESIKVETKYNTKSKASIDRGQIEQVFLNLLINSVHAIKPKGAGKIIITSKETGGNIEISFSDTGIGIDKQVKAKIFDPFFTTKGAWAKDGLGISGTGLGLSIVHSIIKNHNGTITVKSQKNKGTTFIIKLPVDTSNQVAEEKIGYNITTHDIEKIREMRILLVDDENEMTEIFSQFFKKAGFQNYKIENNGEKAVSIFKEFRPDIVFLDIVMPEMSGEKILKEIKAIDKKTPVVFMSGKIDAEKDIYIKNGAFDYIQKPFEINEIYQMLSRIIKSDVKKIRAYSR